MRDNKTHMMKNFIIFSVVLFLLIFTLGSTIFMCSMQNIIKNNKGNELLQLLEIQRIKLENSINSEIAIVLKLADSPLIKRYFASPSDSEIEQYVLEEIGGYRRAFSSFSIFWINDVDMIFYSDDNTPYVVDPGDPSNYWYNMTLYETEVYNFNINYNPDLNTTKLWINAPVFDENHNPLGMVGTGIELTAYVDMLYNNMDDGISLYLFNEAGEVTGSLDIESVTAKMKIEDILTGVGMDILDEAKSLQPGEARTFDTSLGKIVIGTIPVLGWYTIAVAPVSLNDYDTTMVALFLVMFAVIAFILIIFNVFISGVLKSLKKTMDSLEATSKAKSSFLAMMSHEIRTPLNAILGVAQIGLQKEGLPNDYAASLETIYGSGNSLLGIINDILDMSKIETGKLELNPSAYDMPSMINDAVQLNMVRIGSKPINFILDIDEALPLTMHGDELRLKQILSNLLSNAIKYTQEGHVKLSVSHSAQGEDAVLRFSVEDTGQGMKPEDLKKLFSEYSRFNTEANRATEGTGLGLSITKRLVEMMDGTIQVQSEYGKGSVFTVAVRQRIVSFQPIGAEFAQKLRSFTFAGERQSNSIQITRIPMPYGKVLIVDDVEANLHVAEGLLAPYQLKTETAGSGFDAIEKIQSGKKYDVIFMDHMMPQMDGIETTQKLRAQGYTDAIVALTANALTGNDKLFAQNGFDGFISKPMDIQKLNEVLNQFISDRHPEEAKQQTETVAEKPAPEASAADPELLRLFCLDAQKAVVTLRETAASGDLKLFATTAHGLRPVLVAIGEPDTSAAALALEQAAKDGDAAFVSENAESFVKTLEHLTIKHAPKEVEAGALEEGDMAYLAMYIQDVISACEEYDDAAAYAAIDKLKEKQWKPQTAAALGAIRDILFLHSDFEAAATRATEVWHIFNAEQ